MVMRGSSKKRDRGRNAAVPSAGSGCIRLPGDLLTVSDVAALLRVSRKTVTRLIERGLPGYLLPVRGGWRFKPQEVLNWLETQKLGDG